jgi:hypothetical protein
MAGRGRRMLKRLLIGVIAVRTVQPIPGIRRYREIRSM